VLVSLHTPLKKLYVQLSRWQTNDVAVYVSSSDGPGLTFGGLTWPTISGSYNVQDENRAWDPSTRLESECTTECERGPRGKHEALNNRLWGKRPNF